MDVPALQFGLLGPVEARRGGSGVHLGPPKRRVLLTRLLIEDGRPVSPDRLCDDLWEGAPPSGALSSLHAHISRLRTALEPHRRSRGAATVLVSGTTGYRLDAPSDTRDTVRFEAAAREARDAFTRGDLAQASHETEQALGLWRGSALADSAAYAFAARETARLEESRLAVEELRAAILFHQGDFQGTVHAAEELTTRAPLREASWVLLMRALYLSHRSAESLRRFESVRRMLAQELGVDPGPALRETHLAVLRQDTAALAPVRSGTAGALGLAPAAGGVPEPVSAFVPRQRADRPASGCERGESAEPRRLSELDGSARALLEYLAVAGGSLDEDLMTRVRAVSREGLRSMVEAAVAAHLLVWDDSGAAGRTGGYRLPEPVRRLLLGGLTASRRQAVHVALARAVSELPGHHPVRAARHLLAAGPLVPREELALAALRAGRRFASDEQHAEAETWFRHAAALTRRPGVKTEAVHAMGVSRLRLRELDIQVRRINDTADGGSPALASGAVTP